MKKDKLAETQIEIEKKMEDAREKIANTDIYGPFGHNIVGLILRDVANNIGTKYANDLVYEFELEENLGINPVEE